MDEKDHEIIRFLQDSFPLDPEPYRIIGDQLWIDEVTVISRIARLMQDGTIRHLGPFFDSRKLGYSGTLAAIQIDDDKIDEVAQFLAGFPQITHNYLREGTPNMWFTVIAKTREERDSIIVRIKDHAGVSHVDVFPAKKFFKVKVDLD